MFEDIKIGDYVLTYERVGTAFNPLKRIFTVRKRVINTTKTQFTIETGERFMKSGKKVGAYSHARTMVNNSGWVDETIEMKDYRKAFNLHYSVAKKIRDLKIPSPPNHERLLEADKIINQLIEVLDY